MRENIGNQEVNDPLAGSIIHATAGKTVGVSLSCSNDADKPLEFQLEAEGLPPAWAPGLPVAKMVPGYGSASLRLEIRLPEDAGAGDYVFDVWLAFDGQVIDPPGRRELTLRVEALHEDELVDEAPVSQPPTPPPVEPQVEAPVEPPVAGREEPLPPPPPPPKPAEQRLVDLPVFTPEEEEGAEEEFEADQMLRDLKNGSSIYVRPGESALVRYSFTNEQPGTRTFVLQEDRSLDSSWIRLEKDQVSLRHNGSGDVVFSLHPPSNASPASYPFTVKVGPQGQPLVEYALTLVVLPVPAVRLKTKAPSATVGPFGRNVDFDVAVESAGNSDSAYRISVKDGLPDAEDVSDVYEAPPWRYAFDKELASLESPASGRAPVPIQHKVRATRKGVWWLGWRERHRFSVSAVPVTDRKNGNKHENAVTLTATRWRLLPLPWFLMVPLVVTILSLPAPPAKVHKAFQPPETRIFYVFSDYWPKTRGPATVNVTVTWSRLFWLASPKKSEAGCPRDVKSWGWGWLSDHLQVKEFVTETTYQIGSLLQHGDACVVQAVALRTHNMLTLQLKDGRSVVPLAASELSKDGSIRPADYTVDVPPQGTTITLKNEDPVVTIICWGAEDPLGFRVGQFVTSASYLSISAHESKEVSITIPSGGHPNTSGDNVWTFVTTDDGHQVVKVHLRSVQAR